MTYSLLDEKIKELKEEYKDSIEINSTGCLKATDRIKCKCKICGNKWEPKLYYLTLKRGCSKCSRRERLKRYSDTRIKNVFEKCVEYGKDKGYEILEVSQEEKNLYVRYYNHNKDKNNKDFGEYRMLYYSFINGIKSKKEIGDELKLTTEEWVNKAKMVHPEYDYTKTQYINNRISVIITCRKHGDFSISPKVFMKKEYRCEKCKKEEVKKDEKIKLEKYLEAYYPYIKMIDGEKGRKKHFICDKHGEFWQSINNIYKGVVCPQCGRENAIKKKKGNTEEFIKKSKEIHGNKYDYTKVKYVNNNTKVCIICHEKDELGIEHGEFWQLPTGHLSGMGCSKCSNGGGVEYKGEIFLEKMKILHPEYDFSNTIYQKTHDKVEVRCTCKDEFGVEHGKFYITPHNLLAGYGCKKCSRNFMDKQLFIKRSNVIHGDKYDYSKVEYVNGKTKVCIICPEHGEFWQTPSSHLIGRACPLCKTSHFEREINQCLKQCGIEYTYQYRNKDVFGRQSLDFYFPEKKIGIECQGDQHFIANFFKSKGIEYAERHLEYVKELDKKKREICKELGITLIYYLDKKFEKYMEDGFVYFTDKDKLVEYIKGLN